MNQKKYLARKQVQIDEIFQKDPSDEFSAIKMVKEKYKIQASKTIIINTLKKYGFNSYIIHIKAQLSNMHIKRSPKFCGEVAKLSYFDWKKKFF